ncbi:2-C-methyl-D-erythritol 4-phosphate cytidylyltransferase [Mycolicibacterium sp. BiH015]|uniref:IspD/TarI family cytidylyltransferase n=1 Tax=Mycolicibacterium sp. BiH015 TaxID=3018808 RepID=UPI0022DF8615|nr:2-C-methyl-D-erythritol 4-phosphate cytidylyltransferase [Mycolicibacterium sp. BiH015]MDA2893771.1 2-C-methyl-D-erythritol 4-phosphate cytidylyltransferase [Mycolicibacterium sp. BiH015]
MTVTAILPVPTSLESRREAVFSPVAGLSPLARIVRSLAAAADVIVAAAAPLVDEVKTSLAAQGLSGTRVCVADDPGVPTNCIAAALRVPGVAEQVLLHDIAWPLVSPVTLARVMDALRDGAAAVLPVCPVTDSIKAVDSNGTVTATVERTPLRTVQYPRGFSAAVLSRLLTHDGAVELDAVLASGVPVTYVDGDTDAMAVELPGDASYLAAVIEGRSDGSGC